MAPHSCLRLLRKISGFTNCPHPYKDDGKGGCIEKESGNLGCDPPQFQCGDDCCEIPLGCEWPWVDCGDDCCEIPIQRLFSIILFIMVIILTPPLLRSRAGSEKDNDRVDSVEDGKVPFAPARQLKLLHHNH